MEKEIFGRAVYLKSVGCNTVGLPGHPIAPSVNLFVKVTKGCNAHCPFCSNAGGILQLLHLMLKNWYV